MREAARTTRHDTTRHDTIILRLSKPNGRVLFASLFVLILLLAAVMFMRRPQPFTLNPQPLKVGSLAPDFTFSDSNGKIYRLSAFRGKKGDG
jgi:hypothetical protein